MLLIPPPLSLFSLFLFLYLGVCTYPRSKGNKLEDALNGEEHGEGEVHVGEDVHQHQRGAVKLIGPDSQPGVYIHANYPLSDIFFLGGGGIFPLKYGTYSHNLKIWD